VAQVELGSLLLTGQHAAFTVEQARAIGFGGYVAQAFVGSLTLGTVLALAGGLVTWAVSRRFRRRTPLSDAIARTVARYATAPRADRAYVEVKLTSDPVVGLLAEHRELVPRFVGNEEHQRRGTALQSGFSAESAARTQLGAALPAARFGGNATLGRVVDAGAGRGQLGLLLVELGRCSSLTAFDWDARKVEVARAAAGAEARVERAALTDWSWDEADTVLFVDVLHYLDRQEQDDVLRRAARALAPGGRVLVRDVDASQGWRSFVTTLAERIGTGCGYNRGARLCFRPAAELEAVLTSCGLDCDVRPASEGTPLANVLIDARRSRSSR
jgi:2-polyprenyl-3-methyl-5-hydroxy-6-metoxy-1,4-benzoquinol methylase